MSGFDNVSETVRTTAAATTLTNNDYDLLCLAITGNIVVTVPAASTFPPGRTFRVYKDAAAFTVTITPTGATIDGAATKVLAASAAHAAVFVTDGTNWFSTSSY